MRDGKKMEGEMLMEFFAVVGEMGNLNKPSRCEEDIEDDSSRALGCARSSRFWGL